MGQQKFEIHMHSCFSDGEFSPTRLVEIAQENKVSILSLTDHDTFSGHDEFIEACEGTEVFGFPGIEMTVRFHDFNLHLLGYFKSRESILPELKETVETLKDKREQRMVDLIARLDEVLPEEHKGRITLENVKKAAEGVIARPHLAREMVRLGIVKDTQDAFDKYLVQYNIEKKNFEAEEAIAMIRKSNGVPVIAHPGERNYSLHNPKKGRGYPEVESLLDELMGHGLLGMECVYPYHDKIGKSGYYLELAKKKNLIATGSRDFHGFHYSQSTHVLGTTPMKSDFLEEFQHVWG